MSGVSLTTQHNNKLCGLFAQPGTLNLNYYPRLIPTRSDADKNSSVTANSAHTCRAEEDVIISVQIFAFRAGEQSGNLSDSLNVNMKKRDDNN